MKIKHRLNCSLYKSKQILNHISNCMNCICFLEPGRPKVSDEKINVIETGPISFSCVSTAKPPLPVEWKKVTKPCKEEDTKCSKEEEEVKDDPGRVLVDKENGVLNFTNVRTEDAGEYVCIQYLGDQYESASLVMSVTGKQFQGIIFLSLLHIISRLRPIMQ